MDDHTQFVRSKSAGTRVTPFPSMPPKHWLPHTAPAARLPREPHGPGGRRDKAGNQPSMSGENHGTMVISPRNMGISWDLSLISGEVGGTRSIL